MKKLAIMFVMLLGSVATMQAQSFDFSCVALSENSWSALAEEFTPSQMVSLANDGYVMSEDVNENEQLAQTFPDVSYTYVYPSGTEFTFQTDATVSVQTGSFIDGRDDAVGADQGPFTYKVNIRGGTFNDLSFYNDVDEVLAFLLSIYRPAPDSDDDGNGFTVAEEELLAAPIDNLGTGNFEPFGDFTAYQIFFGTEQEVENIEISIVNGMFNVAYYLNSDWVSESNHATLELALAAAEAIING